MTYNICPTGVVPRRISDGKQPDLFPETLASTQTLEQPAQQLSMSAKYPKYYKDVSNLREIDVYQVHQLFDVQDPSGALQHASKKLLLSGVRTGGKSKYDDIREARDTLSRWLQINQQTK